MKMKIQISLSSSLEAKFVDALRKQGFVLNQDKSSRELAYNGKNFDLKKLKAAMKAASWESQGKDLFPSSDGSYYVARIDGEELAVFYSVNKDGSFYLDFSGY